MRITLAILAMLLCASANAYQAPSAISGWYATPDRIVRLVYSRADPQVLTDILAVTDAGMPSFYLPSLYAPNACPSESYALPLAPGVWFAVKGATAVDGEESLQVQVGSQFAVAAGIGEPQTWSRLRSLPSPGAYSCGTPTVTTPHYARLCRQYGIYCGG